MFNAQKYDFEVHCSHSWSFCLFFRKDFILKESKAEKILNELKKIATVWDNEGFFQIICHGYDPKELAENVAKLLEDAGYTVRRITENPPTLKLHSYEQLS